MPSSQSKATSSIVLCSNEHCSAYHLVVLSVGRPKSCSYCGRTVRSHPVRGTLTSAVPAVSLVRASRSA